MFEYSKVYFKEILLRVLPVKTLTLYLRISMRNNFLEDML